MPITVKARFIVCVLASVTILAGCKDETQKETDAMAEVAIDVDVWEQKVAKKFKLGMSQEQVIENLGKPFKIETGTDGGGTLTYAISVPKVDEDCITGAQILISNGNVGYPKGTAFFHMLFKPHNTGMCRYR